MFRREILDAEMTEPNLFCGNTARNDKLCRHIPLCLTQPSEDGVDPNCDKRIAVFGV